MAINEKRRLFEEQASRREYFVRRNRTYYNDLKRFYRLHTPAGARVLELGSGRGDLLAALKPSFGVGVDFCWAHVQAARERHPECHFVQGDVAALPLGDVQFDYIILSDLVDTLDDIQSVLDQLRRHCHPGTRLICNFFNHLWEPVLRVGQRFGVMTPNPFENWLSLPDIENLLFLSGFETVSRGTRLLFPRKVPLVSYVLNRILGNMPFVRRLCLTQFVVARPEPAPPDDWRTRYSVSVVIPTRDEAGNVSGCFDRTPHMGRGTELIFVDGGSTDGTREAIEEAIRAREREWVDVLLVDQGDGRGKGDAVRKGFARARGDILMILDSDLTMPPEDLPKYYEAIARGRGEFINGSRMIYPMEKRAMRVINFFGNKTFSLLFSWLLDQRITDTLCGTKVLWRRDYETIVTNREYFGDFDPFGDFDLLFGAARFQRKIVDLPIRYRERTYGDIKIQRWRHSLLLFRMCRIAMTRLKFQ